MFQEAEFFRENGFVVLKGLFTDEEIKPISNEVNKIINGEASYMPQSDLAYEPNSTNRIRNAFRLTEHNPFFLAVARHPKLVRIMEDLLRLPLRLYSSQLFAKPPHIGSAVPLHQDIAYWPFEPPELISAWIALDDSTTENGCVRLVAGSHKLGRLHHIPSGIAGNSLVLDDQTIAEMEEVYVEVPRGSVVLHHCLTAHRSEPNSSTVPRRGLIMIYMSANVRPTDNQAFANSPAFPLISS
jgi:phytanoyl-CoA hydroxylase